jgi:hypothetical protein
MTIERAKELLGDDASKYSNEQLMKIIEFFTAIANTVSK